MKKLILVSLAVMAAHFSGAQEKKQYEVKNFKGLVNIKGPCSGLVIEGHSGTSVIIEAEGGEGKVPEKATGLRMVTAGGLDNTGISATVDEETTKVITSINEKGEEKEEEIRVLTINIPYTYTNQLFKNYIIKIPHGLTTRFRQSDEVWGRKGALEIRSFEGELDVNCSGCNLDVSGFSGNIIATNSYGSTTRIEFTKLTQDKITSINADGELEVILPGNTKANLKMSSQRGNVYTDFDLKKAVEKKKSDGSLDEVLVSGYYASPTRVRSTGQGSYTIEGEAITPNLDSRSIPKLALASVAAAKRSQGRYDYTINDGGVYVNITSSGGNVYLKKK